MLRGLALIYIVFDHIVEFLLKLHHPGSAKHDVLPVFDLLDRMTEGTRLPLLMFLAGLFVERGICKGESQFIVARLKGLVWPLVLWSVFHIFILSRLTHNPIDLLSGDLRYFLQRGAHLTNSIWFLHALTLYIALFLVVRRSNPWHVLAFAIVWFMASVVLEFQETRGVVGAFVHVFGQLFVFFWLAHMLSGWVIDEKAAVPPRLTVLFSTLFLGVAALIAFGGPGVPRAVALASGLAAIPLLLSLGPRLPGMPFAGLVDWAGQSSMAILCLHQIVLTVLVQALPAVGSEFPLLTALGLWVATLGMCCLIDVVLRRRASPRGSDFVPRLDRWEPRSALTWLVDPFGARGTACLPPDPVPRRGRGDRAPGTCRC